MKHRIIAWIWVAAGAVLVFRTGANVYRLWKTGDRVTEAEKQLANVKEENIRLREQWQEVQTPEFMEREVREKLGYGKPGEVAFVIGGEQGQEGNTLSPEEEMPNWKKWRKLYLGF